VPVGARRHPGCGAALRPMACRFNGGRGSGGEVVSCLARPALGRRLRIQPQVGEKLLDHPPLEDGRDDLQLPGAAVRLELQADVERQLRGIEFRYLCFRLGSRRASRRPGRRCRL
jgi:hypothetical protein